jgi:Holliday junction resolvase
MACAREKSLEKRVVDYVRGKGGYITKIHGNEFVQGLPDLIGCYRGFFLAFEIKSAEGKARPMQDNNIRLILKAEGVALKVRNIDAVKNAIEEIDRRLDQPLQRVHDVPA